MYLARGLRRSAARDVMSEKRLRNAPKLVMHEIATTATLEIFIVSSMYSNGEKR